MFINPRSIDPTEEPLHKPGFHTATTFRIPKQVRGLKTYSQQEIKEKSGPLKRYSQEEIRQYLKTKTLCLNSY